jgi:diaminopimelate epimerase
MNSPAATVPFVKACACGNDFLIIDGVNAPADWAEFSRQICDRHQGVGADGVEWLFPAAEADIQARLLNADGSEAEISGNGTRCVAAFLCFEQAREKVAILTGAGVKVCRLCSHSGVEYEFEIAMGSPKIGEGLAVKLASGEVRGIPVSMGNPHFVIFRDEFSSGWPSEAAAIGRHSAFSQGVNVEFVKPIDRGNIDVRFFERGVGETQSSGTGCCASAVAAIASRKAVSPVRVHARGGVQTVRWEEQIYLRGSARLICRGEFFI